MPSALPGITSKGLCRASMMREIAVSAAARVGTITYESFSYVPCSFCQRGVPFQHARATGPAEATDLSY